MLFKESLISYH